MNKKYKVMLDMDGVLADFDRSIEENYREGHQLRVNLFAMAKNLPEPYCSAHYKDMSDLLRDVNGNRSDPKLRVFKRMLNETKSKIFGFASNSGFFINLPKMKDAEELFAGVEELTGTPGILTAPLHSNPTCVEEKHAWIDKHFAGRYDVFIAEKNKEIHATPTTILIDDTPKKIRAFVEAGGIGILHTDAKSTLAALTVLVRN